MTKVTYQGTSDMRVVDSADVPGYVETEDDVTHREWVWTPGSWLDIPDEVALFLLEYSRLDFVLYEDPKGRDHRTKDELLAEAAELDITGRSSMNKEQLLDSIYERRAEVEAIEKETAGETTESNEPIEVQSDLPDRAPEAEDQV